MSQGENTIVVGTGSQTSTYSRWGDYSSMSVDPVDDCTFWYTTEYVATTGQRSVAHADRVVPIPGLQRHGGHSAVCLDRESDWRVQRSAARWS